MRHVRVIQCFPVSVDTLYIHVYLQVRRRRSRGNTPSTSRPVSVELCARPITTGRYGCGGDAFLLETDDLENGRPDGTGVYDLNARRPPSRGKSRETSSPRVFVYITISRAPPAVFAFIIVRPRKTNDDPEKIKTSFEFGGGEAQTDPFRFYRFPPIKRRTPKTRLPQECLLLNGLFLAK